MTETDKLLKAANHWTALGSYCIFNGDVCSLDIKIIIIIGTVINSSDNYASHL